MKIRVELVSLALIFAAVGCPTDNNDGNGTGSVPIASLPSEIAAVFCDVISQCQGSFGGSRQACIDQFAADFEDTTVAQWKAGVERGTFVYDESKMGACLDAFKAQGCAAMEASGPPAACDEALVGKVAAGGACQFDEECTGGQASYCDTSAACPGTCAAYLAKDADCSSGQCADGLDCVASKCTPRAGLNEACGGQDNINCIGSLNCDWDPNGNSGTCKAPVAPTLVDLDASCDPGNGVMCKDGLSCVLTAFDSTNGTTTQVCKAPAAAGGACGMGYPEHCPANQYCAGVSIPTTMEGTCAPLAGEGQTCVDQQSGTGCQEGLSCDGNSKCVKPKRLGEACAGDSECVSDSCSPATNKCAVPEC